MNMAENLVTVGIHALSVSEVVNVARHGWKIELAEDSLKVMSETRARIDELAGHNDPVYGVSTGFGALARKHIPEEKRTHLQCSLVRSHAAGSGPEVETEVIRALMLLRLSTLATGRTGVRVEVADSYLRLLNAGLTPRVHEYGSLGCSGDLAPLSHCALALMGEGNVRNREGHLLPAAEALEHAGISPVILREKEGLALINGTDGMLGQLCLALTDLQELAKLADLAAAMSVQGLRGTTGVFEPHLQALRPQPGQALSAANILALCQESEILDSAFEEFKVSHVQDAYSIRCAPQVAGGFRDTLAHAEKVADNELAAAIDNPVVTPEGDVRSNGNFHGAPIAYVLDFLAIVVADLASISERRTDRFLDPARNRGLHPFLADDPGVDSGHMIAQYTQAAIVSELKRLANPASVDSIPSSAMQEDHVSMGWSAARKLRKAVDGLRRVLAIEILTAARAIDMRGEKPSAPVAAVIARLRQRVPGVGPDRFLAPEIEETVTLLSNGELLSALADTGITLR
ncbi:histidine ammonia-lyase [Corynebacterium poyangense]|uniref:histidine ammonia-lyase n=1 Tax=Corynebacterium poyangense TaxID=2684405 RepID=UPI0037BF640F